MASPFSVQNPATNQVVYTVDALGNTVQTGTVVSGDGVSLTKTPAPATPSGGELKVYSPDGQSLWTVNSAGVETEVSPGADEGGVDWLNVVDFGADPTGVADSAAAFNAALSAANAQGGGTVYVPWGVYTVSSTISIPPYTFLRGQTQVTLALGTTFPASLSRIVASASWAPSSATGIVSFLSKTPGGWSVNPQSSGLKDIFLDGSLNSSTNLSGIILTGPVYDTHLEDVFLWKMPHNGIQVTSQAESGITPNEAYHQKYDRVSAVFCAGVSFNFVNLTDCTFTNLLGFGAVGNNFTLGNNSNTTFVACRAEWSSGGRGFDITGSSGSMTFTGCTTDQNTGEGLRIHAATGQTGQGGGIVWTGGKLHADGNGGTNNHGIIVTGSTVPVVISGTNVESGQNPNNSSYYPAQALEIDTSSFVTVTGCVLQGISSAYTAGASNTDVVMSNCIGATGDPLSQTFALLPNIVAGSNTSQGAPVITGIGASSGVAKQLSDLTQDYMVYFNVTTAGTTTSITIGHTSAASDLTVMASAAAVAGQVVAFRLPAGWWLKWTGTTTVFAQNAVGC